MVHHVQRAEVALIDLNQRFLEQVNDVRVANSMSKRLCHLGEKFHLLGLIIEQFGLLLLTRDVPELSSDN